jgi:hypothetical protein
MASDLDALMIETPGGERKPRKARNVAPQGIQAQPEPAVAQPHAQTVPPPEYEIPPLRTFLRVTKGGRLALQHGIITSIRPGKLIDPVSYGVEAIERMKIEGIEWVEVVG